MRRSLRLTLFVLLTPGCASGLVLSPYRSKEAEVGPASAEGRHAMVLERAASYEQASPKSRDVFWYRVWRASAMVGLGQIEEGDALAASVLSDLGSPANAPPDSGRLKLFAYDVRARAALLRQQPAEALALLDRAMSYALESPPANGERCGLELAIAARTRQIADVAALAGDADRAGRARAQLERKLEDWAICVARLDYPSFGPLVQLKGALSPLESVAVAPSPPPAPAPAVAGKNTPKPAAAISEPEAAPVAPAAPVSAGFTAAAIKYGPIDATPYRAAIDNLETFIKRNHKSAAADVIIRIDGSRRAVRVRVPSAKPLPPAAMVLIFKNTVVFFEQTRDLTPKLDEVLLVNESAAGTTQLVASKNDVMDLFLDRLDEAAFLKRVVEVR